MSGIAERLTPEQMAEVRAYVEWQRDRSDLLTIGNVASALLHELDAVTRERDAIAKISDMNAPIIRDYRTALSEIIERPDQAGLIARRAIGAEFGTVVPVSDSAVTDDMVEAAARAWWEEQRKMFGNVGALGVLESVPEGARDVARTCARRALTSALRAAAAPTTHTG